MSFVIAAGAIAVPSMADGQSTRAGDKAGIRTVQEALAALQSRGASHPEENPANWFTADDYPPDAIRVGAEGRVKVEVTLTRDAKITDCRIVESSGSASLDETTCRLVRERGRFAPALDAKKRPTASTYTLATRWVLPQIPFESGWRRAATVQIDAYGKLLSCAEAVNGSPPREYGKLCPTGTQADADKLIQLRDRAVPGVQEVTLEMAIIGDGDAAVPMTYGRDGRTILHLVTATFDVGADGTVSHCAAFTQVGTDVPWCDHAPRRYDMPAAARPRRVTFTLALSRAAVK